MSAETVQTCLPPVASYVGTRKAMLSWTSPPLSPDPC